MNSTNRFEKVDINKLVPYARNARTHSKEQILQLRSSLREFGFVNPVIVDKDLNIIAGHGRIMAAKEEGLTEIPCVFVEHLTDAQKKAYMGTTSAPAPVPTTPNPATPTTAFKIGDIVQFTGGAVYVSSTAATPVHSRGKSRCKITQIASGKKQPYHLISEDGNGVHGWIEAIDVKAITSTTPAFQPYMVRVTANELNIRKGPGTNHAIVGAIRDKGIYTIVEESNGSGASKWGRLKSGAGWVSLDFTQRR